MCFWNNLHQVRSRSKDWKVKFFFLKSLRAIKAKGPKQDRRSCKAKGPKQDRRSWLTLHMYQGD